MGMTTLCYIEKDNKYLMLHRIKKEHDINKDKWIGVGGHFEHGESPEDCMFREVMEETGLEINNITYFGNQPWPYPSNLMVGFIADYVSGTIRLQDEELSEGAFFTKDNLPELPRKLSLARKMIDWWLEQKSVRSYNGIICLLSIIIFILCREV